MRRVVVTGIGLLTPLGQGTELTWKRILAGQSGAGRISAFDVDGWACQIACEVPRIDGRGGGGPDVEGSFDPELTMSAKDRRRVDDFILYGIAAADEAVRDSGWVPLSDEDRERTGVMIGSGIGGLGTIAETAIELHEKGPRRVSPFFIPSALINLVSGQVSIRYGFKGPNHAVVTACATGAHAIGDACRLIKYGDADVMVAGGAEASVVPVGIAGFIACRAMSTDFNDTPERASRPYDKDRDGFVMGEGAGIVVLEEFEHAKARGAKIYAEVIGYGLSGDAFHITAPAPDEDGAYRCMKAALKRADIAPSDIGYVNAHGTSTPLGDELELGAVERVMGNAAGGLTMSSTKSAIGHLLGAAGAVEAIATIEALRREIAPPTVGWAERDPELDLDYVPGEARALERRADGNGGAPLVALSNSFGFGGHNAVLCLAA